MFPWEEIRNSEGGTALDRPLPIQASGVSEGVTLLARIPTRYKRLIHTRASLLARRVSEDPCG